MKIDGRTLDHKTLEHLRLSACKPRLRRLEKRLPGGRERDGGQGVQGRSRSRSANDGLLRERFGRIREVTSKVVEESGVLKGRIERSGAGAQTRGDSPSGFIQERTTD
jgi:hypothetical protein